MNIIEAITDANLLHPFLADADGKLTTWWPWLSALRAVYGLPIPAARRELIQTIIGRDPAALPRSGFRTALFLTGRRSGKSASLP